MFIDDVIYVGLLLVSVAFGSVFRGLKGSETRQWVSTAMGFSIAWIVSGRHVAHPILSTLINAVILTQCSWRKRHVVSFCFMFFYLLVVCRLGHWIGLPDTPAHTNLMQMLLTLRLAGLGFEIDAAKREEASNESSSVRAMQNVGFLDVIHYGFSYMGILTGPYYRYRTYWDCINKPFAKYTNCWSITEYKLKIIAVLIVLHLTSGFFFPSDYLQTEEFRSRTFLYKIWYAYPAFITFRTRIYAGMTLSECVCHMAGLGAYPSSCDTVSGLGPRKYKEAEELINGKTKIVHIVKTGSSRIEESGRHIFGRTVADDDNLKIAKMDFETVHNIDIFGVETCHEVRKAMKMWNTTVQYWMAAYVYKQFPLKALRTAATFLLSALWHGYAIGYHMTITSVIFYLPFEDLFMKFFKQSKEDGMVRKFMHAFMFITRYSWMSYTSLGFQTLSFDKTYKYYSNVYFVGHAIVGVYWIIGSILKPILIAPKEPISRQKIDKQESKIQ